LQATLLLRGCLQPFQFPFAFSLDRTVLTKSKGPVGGSSPRLDGSPAQEKYWRSEFADFHSVRVTQDDWKAVPCLWKETETLHRECFPAPILKLRGTRLSRWRKTQ